MPSQVHCCAWTASVVMALSIPTQGLIAAPPVTFTAVPLPPGTGASYAQAISGDGSTVVGWAAPAPVGDNERAFRWIVGDPPEFIGPAPAPGTFTIADAVSYDGSAVSGRTSGNAFRWSTTDGYQEITPPLGATRTNTASGISADGGVVVGNIQTPDGPRGYRWTSAGGAMALPLPDPQPNTNEGRVRAVSADGDQVVGWSRSASGYHGYLWSATTGFEQTALGLPGGQASYASDISASGSVVIGRTEFAGNVIQGWAWSVGSGYTVLPQVPGFSTLNPTAISGDGMTVVGAVYPTDYSDPFVWSKDTGTVLLRDLLTSNGVDLTGWTLGTATDVSFDGTSITGLGDYAGQVRGWIVTIPSPGSLGGLGLGLALAATRRRRSI